MDRELARVKEVGIEGGILGGIEKGRGEIERVMKVGIKEGYNFKIAISPQI
jgi:hypothetical protein